MLKAERRPNLLPKRFDTESRLFGYLAAIATVAFTSVLRLGVNFIWQQRFPYLVFLPAIVASGVIGGIGPGLLSIVLSAVAVSFLVYPPLFTFQLGPNNDLTGLAVFGLTGLLLAAISAAQRQARFASIASAAQAIASRDALRISEERFVTTLRSIGDGVLATDSEGRVTFLNSIAADLTGWTESEALGKDVHQVFDIVHETTRQPVPNPIDRVLREGVIVGLANHTILRGRGGHEYCIDDSGAPIRDSAGQLVGAVLVFRDISDRRQVEQEQESLALRNAVENRIGAALRSGLAPSAIQAVATAALGEALGADRCYLALTNISPDRVIIQDDWRKDPALPSVAGNYPLEEFIEDTALLYPRDHPNAISDFENAPQISPQMREYCRQLGVRSAIAYGLYSDEGLIATINVAMADQPRTWTEDEISLVQAVATLTLAVTESARLRDQEHNVAVRLQEVLQPRLPAEKIPGLEIDSVYQAALDESSLGGDFFDVFPLSKTRHAMVVADLAGKGLNAAAQVAVVRYLLRALLYTYSEHSGGVERAITQVNRILAEQRLISGFATLFAGVYDTDDQSFRYVCGGQEPALYFNRKTQTTAQLSTTGPVLGSFTDATFEENRVELAPGDAIAVFTDGLTECGPNRQALLEIDGVTRIWETCLKGHATTPSPSIISRCLLEGALEYARGKLSDDLCLLTLVITAPVSATLEN